MTEKLLPTAGPTCRATGVKSFSQSVPKLNRPISLVDVGLVFGETVALPGSWQLSDRYLYVRGWTAMAYDDDDGCGLRRLKRACYQSGLLLLLLLRVMQSLQYGSPIKSIAFHWPPRYCD